MPRQPRHRVRREQIRVVFHGAVQARGRLGQGQREIEHRGGAVDVDQLDGQVVKVARRSRRVLEHEHRLEQRRSSRVPVNRQQLDEAFERDVLMRVGRETDFTHSPEQ